MNITEKFKERIKRQDITPKTWSVQVGGEKPVESHTLSDEDIDELFNITVEHEGKRYALKIVELDAELPEWDLSGIGSETEKAIYKVSQKDMLNDGWVKGVNDEKG